MFKAFKHFLPLAILYWKRARIFYIAYRIVHYILLRLICVFVRHEWDSPDNCNVILSQCLAKDLMHIAYCNFSVSWNIPSISITLIYETFFIIMWVENDKVPPCAGADAFVIY